MKDLSVRLRLALSGCCLALLTSGAALGVAYLTVDSAVRSQVIDIPTGDASGPEAPGPGEDVALLKARRVEAEDALRARLREQTLAPLAGGGLAAVTVLSMLGLIAGWYAGAGVLRPLRRITAIARRVAERNLHERIPLARARDEWWELGTALNAMLSRLDAAFAAQAQFVGNASHELKTPLAINRTLLEVAMNRSDAPVELLRLGETLLEVNNRHERLVDGLLALARAEHRIADPQPIDLAEVVDGVLSLLRPEADRVGVRVNVDIRSAIVAGDRVLLDRLVQNLIQNAIRHNVSDGWVRVTVGPDDQRDGRDGRRALLTVANTGPVLAQAAVPALFEPFQRATNRVGSTRGTGLGLSIVRSVVRAHSGTVTASAREGGGLTVEVIIPPS